MYVDLLTRVLDDVPIADRSDDALLDDVVGSWAELQASAVRDTPSAAEALAFELSYDEALIRFCASLNVPTDPERFANPLEERARLERELAERGYSVNGR